MQMPILCTDGVNVSVGGSENELIQGGKWDLGMLLVARKLRSYSTDHSRADITMP